MGIRNIHSVNLYKIQKSCVWETDCHSQCAHWLRNDRFYNSKSGALTGSAFAEKREKNEEESVSMKKPCGWVGGLPLAQTGGQRPGVLF